MDRTTDGLSPLDAYNAPSYAMRASPQQVGLQVCSRSTPPSPVAKVFGAFNSRILPLRSVVQARTVAIACVVVRISWTFLTQVTKIFVSKSPTLKG